jgi:hypothetical protein
MTITTRNTIIRFILFHVCFFSVATGVFILSFRLPVFTGTVFFYRGILLLCTVAVLSAVVLVYGKRKRQTPPYTYRDILLALVIFVCFNLVFFTHIPVTADRSVSVFLLGYMNAHSPRTVTEDELTYVLAETYVRSNAATSKRIHEQLQSGTIIRDGDGYRISQRGVLLMRMYGWIAELFGLNNGNITQ